MSEFACDMKRGSSGALFNSSWLFQVGLINSIALPLYLNYLTGPFSLQIQTKSVFTFKLCSIKSRVIIFFDLVVCENAETARRFKNFLA